MYSIKNFVDIGSVPYVSPGIVRAEPPLALIKGTSVNILDQLKGDLNKASRAKSPGQGHSHSHSPEHGHGHSHGDACSGSRIVEDPNIVDPSKIDYYCRMGLMAPLLVLRAQGIDVTLARKSGISTSPTALHWACQIGQPHIIRFLLDCGADVNATDVQGQTPLHWACATGTLEVVDLLLDNGADPNLCTTMGYSAYLVAIQHKSLAHLLLLHGRIPMKPSDADEEGHTGVSWAAYRGDLAILEFCHRKVGMSLTALDKRKRSPLHLAAREGNEDVVNYLIMNNVPTTAVDDEGMTALQHAQTNGHARCSDIIRHMKPSTLPTSSIGVLFYSKHAQLTVTVSLGCLGLCFILSFFYPQFILIFPVVLLLRCLIAYKIAGPARRAEDDFNQPALLENVEGLFLRGPSSARFRDPSYLFCIVAIVLFQLYLSVLSGNTSLIVLALGTLAAIFFILFHSYITPCLITNGTLENSPLHDAIRAKQWHLCEPCVISPMLHTRIPVRASYCVEINRIIRRFDRWSLVLDGPVAAYNARFSTLCFIFFGFMQFAQIISTCIWINDACGSLDIWAVLLNPFKGNDICGVMRDWSLLATATLTDTYAAWCLYVPLVFLFMTFLATLSDMLFVEMNLTRRELLNSYALTSSGKFIKIINDREGLSPSRSI